MTSFSHPVTSISDIRQLWQDAVCIHNDQKIQSTLLRLAEEITHEFQDKNPLFIGLMKGALVFMGQLIPHLPFPLHIDYCHATRFGHSTQGGQLKWNQYPLQSVEGRHVVFVDDIFDEGKTLFACDAWAHDQGAASVHSVVMVEKMHDRKPSHYRPSFIGLEVPDQFVVGYGMDYKDYFRNANGIFAINP